MANTDLHLRCCHFDELLGFIEGARRGISMASLTHMSEYMQVKQTGVIRRISRWRGTREMGGYAMDRLVSGII